MSIELLGVIVLSFTLAVVLFAYDRQLREMRKLKKDKATVDEKARQKAEELVKGARDKAVEIIGEAKVDATKWQQILDQEINKSLQEEIGDYKNKLHTVSEQITADVKSEAGDLKKVLEMETIGAQKAAAERMKEEFAKIDKEAADYRVKKLSQIENDIANILETVAKKAVGKALDFNDQTEMIIDSLEKAKKQNVI